MGGGVARLGGRTECGRGQSAGWKAAGGQGEAVDWGRRRRVGGEAEVGGEYRGCGRRGEVAYICFSWF